MQPYFLPYIGYFQLINAVDKFVIYDNVKFTKKGWINRNRILVNGKDEFITLPLKKDSDFLNINDRSLANTWKQERKKIINRITESYRKAPFFSEAYPLFEKIIMYNNENLFNFILNSVLTLVNYLRLNSQVIVSSSIPINHQLKGEDKVISICKNQKASIFINPIGGCKLYDQANFRKNDIKLLFLEPSLQKYRQYQNDFIPWLSIIDLLMFNPVSKIKTSLNLASFLDNEK